MAMPEHVAERFERLEGLLGKVYLVGGCVRDVLHGREPHDLDFATTLLPDDTDRLLQAAGIKTYVRGKRFGTVGCMLDGYHIEVTTFRTESYDGTTRKPEVIFVDEITADLARRDFTINAMAMRIDGSLIDPFGGKADLEKHMLRAVGNPGDRFFEDPLRMLRAGRFISQLGFTIDDSTFLSAAHHADRILQVSKERWVQELDKLMVGEHADQGLRYLAETRLLTFMLPEMGLQVGYDQDSPYHELDLFEHSVKTVMLTERQVERRWAALLHDVGKPYVRIVNKRGYSNYPSHAEVGAELVVKIGTYLKWSKERTKVVGELVQSHLEDDSPLQKADSAARYT